jgi:glutamine amidotransferase
MKTVHLLDYGVGNIGSLAALVGDLGAVGLLTADPAVIERCPVLILPGVGSAFTALRELAARDLLAPLAARHAAGRPIVGICLGAQLLFGHLDEAPGPGLGFLPGNVAPLAASVHFNTGWCQLDAAALRATGFATGLHAADSYFFNHQYACPRAPGAQVVAIAGRPEVPALYVKGHLCGIQFHPEKSQAQGRRLMKNILNSYHGL